MNNNKEIYKVYEGNNYKIHTIKSKKFKTSTMEVIFRTDARKEDITGFSLLARVLRYSCLKYPSEREMTIRQEELYNSPAYCSFGMVGKTLKFDVSIDFLNPKYCYDGYLKDVLEMPFELLLNPNIKDGAFEEDSFNICWNKHKAFIESEKESANYYSLKRAMENLDPNSPSSFTTIGYLEDLKKIDNKSLLKYYDRLFKEFNCEIYIAGDVDMDEAVKIIKNTFKLDNNIEIGKEFYFDNRTRDKVLNVSETGKYEQDMFIMVYNVLGLTKRERDFVMPIMNTILGGADLTSKLYQYLREQNNLCYSVELSYRRYANLLVIKAGIDGKNKNKCIDLCEKAINEMIDGVFSDEDLANAIKYRITILKFREDSIFSLIDNRMRMNLDGQLELDEMIEEFKTVTKKEICDTAKKLKMNLIYLLKGEK